MTSQTPQFQWVTLRGLTLSLIGKKALGPEPFGWFNDEVRVIMMTTPPTVFRANTGREKKGVKYAQGIECAEAGRKSRLKGPLLSV